jgi:transposase
VVIAESGHSGEVRFLGEIPSSPEALCRLVERLKDRHRQLSFCPEKKRSVGERGLPGTWLDRA